jgi:hypothetical protein
MALSCTIISFTVHGFASIYGKRRQIMDRDYITSDGECRSDYRLEKLNMKGK